MKKSILTLCCFLLTIGFAFAQQTTTEIEKEVDTLSTINGQHFLKFNEKDIELKAEFAKNRGRLPWPVDDGVISFPFGNYKISGCCLCGDNPGLTIDTRPGSPVKSVFDGVIAAVHNFDDGVAVIVRHGKYYTCYSNLSAVNVAKGDSVKCGQVMGKVGDSDDGTCGRIDFMLLVETKNINPQPWLR
ncbi:MAG: hypothetical protein DI535_14790 [Citrobacter freundii]|nr:MAG: hypothetical protein DI535_14790 [Citrobacter freundii]